MILIYTDGACSGNPGPGAYAFAIVTKNHIEIKGEYFESTTNNRMELMAVIESIKYTRNMKEEKIIYTDSKYVYDAISSRKYLSWLVTGKAKNLDLWEKLKQETGGENIRIEWTKGHSNNLINNLVDRVARSLIKIQGFVKDI